jgi:hypothetical protein
MLFLPTLFWLTSTAAVSASCFSGGDKWKDKIDARNKASEACKQLAGRYNSKDVKHVCMNGAGAAGAQKYDFTLRYLLLLFVNVTNQLIMVRYIRTGSRDIAQGECTNGMQSEINSCSSGGRTSYTNWEYT